jgi:hypothetical protein
MSAVTTITSTPTPTPAAGGDTTMKSFVAQLESQDNGITKCLQFDAGKEPLARDLFVSFKKDAIVHRLSNVVKISSVRFLPVGSVPLEPLHWVQCKPSFLQPKGGPYSEHDEKYRDTKISLIQLRLKGDPIEKWSHPFTVYVNWRIPEPVVVETPASGTTSSLNIVPAAASSVEEVD